MTPAPLLQVALGGAIGSVGHTLVGWGVARACLPGFPAGTVAVNFLAFLARGEPFIPPKRKGRLSPFPVNGVPRGYATSPAVSLDAFCQRDRGDRGLAAPSVGLPVLWSGAALVAGIAVARGIG